MPELQTHLIEAPENDPANPRPADREFTVAERGQWQQAYRRFLRHKLAVVSVFVFILLLLFAFVGPLLWKYDYEYLGKCPCGTGPSLAHPMGTDDIGHDGMAIIMRGTQQSLKIALLIALLATVGGSIWGVVSGFFGGLVDSTLMRFADLLLTLPSFALAAALSRQTNGTWYLIAVILGGLAIPYVAHVVRGVVLSLREREFVEAARALGAGNIRIMFRHLLPNSLAVVIVNATLLVATGILGETALSYIGLGIQAPDTSLGKQITTAQNAITTRPWFFYIPGVFIILIALSISFIGDGLRDALDPRQTRQRR